MSEPINCPLCGHHIVEPQACHSACPMAKHCSMIRCPACGYEQPDPSRSKLAGLVSRLLGGKQTP